MKTDAYEAFTEREEYFKNAGYRELALITFRSYLDNIIRNYFKVRDSEAADSYYCKELLERYKNKYRQREQRLPGIGYSIFNYLPEAYYLLKRKSNQDCGTKKRSLT